MSEVFRTERLSVRPWAAADAPRLFEMFRDPEITKWTSIPEPMQEMSEAHARIEKWAEPFEGQPHLGVWTFVPAGIGLASGIVLLRPLADSEAIEIGWSLHPQCRRKGYATEAAAGAIDHAWAHGHTEIIAIMWPDNVRSAAVSERIGMTDLGSVNDPWYGTLEEPTSRMFRIRRP